MKSLVVRSAFIFLAVVLLAACGEETSILPKPRAYPRVIYPEGQAEPFKIELCPFTFSKPSYAIVERDTAFFDEKPKDPCWFDLVTPSLNGRVHMSYYPVSSLEEYEELRDDAYELVGKHNVVANYIDEVLISRPEANVSGFAFDIEGDVASPFQFYISDSTSHFLRGSLYVRAKASSDSLAPIYQFLREDVLELIESLAWEQ
ncbi:MAG: hypothetical protein AB8F78_17510 [Saprospiraceae bacterium]